MRGGTAAVFLVLSIAVAGMMLGASGFAGAWGAEPPSTTASQESLNDSSGQFGPQEGPVSGPVSSSDSAIVGLLASSLSGLVDLAAAAILLGPTLINLGFPAWFAVPIGVISKLIVGVSIVEFAINREWS